MVKCVFCGKEESPFRGVTLIQNNGITNFYCSSKCRKNALKLGRDKKKLKWTEAYRLAREKAVKNQKMEGKKEVKEEQKEEKSSKK